MTQEHSTQSQENLSSPRLPRSQIPRPSERQKSPIPRPRAEYHRGNCQSPTAESAPGVIPEATPENPGEEHQKGEATPEIPSPSAVGKGTVEPAMVREPSGDTVDVVNNTTAEDSVPLSKASISAEGDEHVRAVSCTSTLFFDAPGTLASQPDSHTSIEDLSAAMIMPNLDALVDNFTEKQCLPQARLALERPVSSNYSNSAPSPVSPASPTTPRSPILAPEALREELSSDVETMRQRLFSQSSDIFKSSTWDQNSDLDLATLGRGCHAPADRQARPRVSSEESTVIEGAEYPPGVQSHQCQWWSG